MKYLVLIAVILAVMWFMRGGRRMEGGTRGTRRTAPPPPPQDMVECPVCHVHLPRADALPGPGGQLYCCAEHARSGA